MKFRIITFTLAIAALSAMSACGPNKKRDTTALEDAQKKAAAAAAAGNAEVGKLVLEGNLPHLADGQSTLQDSCVNPVEMQFSGSEKEITAESREILSEDSVFELVSAKVHGQHTAKTGEVGMVTGSVTGPLAISDKSSENDTAAKITCHTSKAEVVKGKTVPASELAIHVPAQITAKSGQASAMAIINLQARKGQTAGRVILMPAPSNVEALLAADTEKEKSSLTSDTDQRIHYRYQINSTSPDGDAIVNTVEAIYAKKQ